MAQVPIMCLACEETNPIAWKCFNCDFQLCDKCKAEHQRDPRTRKHIVTAFKDLTSSKIIKYKKITDNVCKSHGEELLYYCFQCEYFVCPECIEESHRQHDLDKKENIIDKKEAEILLLESNAKVYQASLHTEMDNLKTIRSNVKINVAEMKDAIKLRQHLLHKKIDEQANKVLCDLETIKEDLLEQCDTNKSKIDTDILKVDKMVSSLKTHLANQNIANCERELISLKQKMQQPFEGMTSLPTLVLQGEENFNFGSIQHVQKVENENINTEMCQVCNTAIKNKRTLHSCKHQFCRKCLEEKFKHKRACPTCGMTYDIIYGKQPNGTIKITCRERYYEINYAFNIKFGVFAGLYKFETHLPLTEQGEKVSKLLEVAFERNLVFRLVHNNNTVGITSKELEKVIKLSSQFNPR